MKRFSRLFLTLLVAALFIPTSANAAYVSLENSDSKLYIWGLFQPQFDWFDYESGSGNDHPGPIPTVLDDEGPQLNPERVRFGTRYNHGAWEFGFQFNALESSGVEDRHAFISDAYGRYTFGDPLVFQAGKFKTPLGMEYNIPGNSLPMAERTMISRLVVGRTLGGMLSGRNIFGDAERGGFGYDLSYSNFSDTEAHLDALENTENAHGDDYAYVGRLLYNHHNRMHFEVSYGVMEDAGSNTFNILDDQGNPVTRMVPDGMGGMESENVTRTESEHYEIMDIGAMYTHGPMRIRAEYADASDVLGIADNDEDVWYVEGSYRLNQMIEGVVRYQDAQCEGCGVALPNSNTANTSIEQDLSRFEVGVNLYLGQNDYNGRVQVYYAVAGDDKGDYSGVAGNGYGQPGDVYDVYKYDQFAVQLQVYF